MLNFKMKLFLDSFINLEYVLFLICFFVEFKEIVIMYLDYVY